MTHSTNQIIKSKTSLEKFIEKASETHGLYDYTRCVYQNNKIPVEIICPTHGSFLQTPNTHLGRHGCPRCGVLKRASLKRSNVNDFIKKSKRIFGNRYDYSLVDYSDAFSKVCIICKLHGSFYQTPNIHLGGHGCPQCGRLKVGTVRRSTTEEFIEKARSVHGNRYRYSLSNYVNNSTKICIECPKHGVFFQKPNNHLSGHNCPRCNMSKGELKIENFLLNIGIEYIKQKKFEKCRNPNTNRRLKFDFYIPSKNILIEYDGEQHFRQSFLGGHYNSLEELNKLQMLDGIKTKFASENGITLIRIPYTEFNEIDNILTEKIST